MKNKTPKIYVTDKFKELKDMHRTNNAMAKKFGVYPATMTNAMQNKPVQASFVASMLLETGIPFESLFKAKR